MTVRHDDSVPVRSIELEIDVPGTPEQVWQAIATGPGFSAWFCPTTVEEREGGAVKFVMGPGLESGGVVTVWDPPRRFVAEEREWFPGAPPVATEIVVEAKAGGICRVRLVNSLFTSKTDWDDQLEGVEKGWPLFLEILRLYLTHFPAALCAPARVMSVTTMGEEHAWTTLLGALGLAGATPGQRHTTRGLDAPELAGVVESVREHALLLRIDEPGPGIVALGSSDCGPQGMLVWLSLHFYGDAAAPIAAREEPKWQAWLAARFATDAPAGAESEAAEALQ
jgi:uncharacterized protein YndB with AHSA1/START domain